MEFTEEQIIVGIRHRKNDVFVFLDKKIRRSIRAHVMLNRGSDEDADDCYNDSIVVLIRMVDRHDFKCTCKLTTLLFDIAKNQWLQKLERRGPAANYRIRHNEDTIVELDDEELDQPLYKRIFDECWKRLDRECRQILRAYMKGMNGKEMAELFDYKASTIRKKKCICHAALRKMVYDHPEYKKIKRDEEL